MKHTMIAMAFCAAISMTAVGQTTPSTSQPAGTNPSTMPQQQTPPDMAPSGSSSPAGTSRTEAKGDNKGDKKIKGCLQNSGGKYTIEDKHGKQVVLTGSQDFSAHVGHTVAAHGTFANGSDSSSGASATSTTGAAGSADQFMVTKLDMVSESCSGDKSKSAKDSDHDNMSKPNPNHK
jgi:hypothetical protein